MEFMEVLKKENACKAGRKENSDLTRKGGFGYYTYFFSG